MLSTIYFDGDWSCYMFPTDEHIITNTLKMPLGVNINIKITITTKAFTQQPVAKANNQQHHTQTTLTKQTASLLTFFFILDGNVTLHANEPISTKHDARRAATSVWLAAIRPISKTNLTQKACVRTESPLLARHNGNMRPLYTFVRVISVLGLLAGAYVSAQSDAAADFPQPSLEHSPEDVVRIQVSALGNNDDPYPDAGIAITFNFASPQNRQVTGPLERFVNLVKNPLYIDMLNHVDAEYSPVEMEGDQARIDVVLTTAEGERVGYSFLLSRQASGEYEGMWMTDAVGRFDVDDADVI
jgi:hypothetical protein